MHIGIDIRLIGKKRTGDEVVIFNLVKNLARIPSSHTFTLFTDETESGVLDDIARKLEIENNQNFTIASLGKVNKFVWNFWTLQRYLRTHPVDVYHTQYIAPFFVPRFIKIVTIVHDISFNFYPQFIRWSDLFFLKTLLPLSLRRADKIVGVSKFTHDEIIKYYGLPDGKVAWMHNALSEEFLQDVPDGQLRRIQETYALPEKYILYLGTLQPRKNLAHLIEAYARIKDDIADIKLVICGNRSAVNFDNRIDAAIKRHHLENDVCFPGFIDEKDKKGVFQLAHVFAFPSVYEGFGLPLLEAMSQSVPVIAADIPSLKEIAGDSALFFDATDLDDFAKKLYDICVDNSLREKLILSGNERVGFFSWAKTAQSMLALYEDLFHNKY